VICPMGGRRPAFVLWLTGEVCKFPADSVPTLVSRPWALATNASAEEIHRIMRQAVVQVPAHLRPAYPKPYRPAAEVESGTH